ncbi:DUF1642 domain-containing protein [Streptococcus australis]|uniref:DUF1642 domain-containing protein n=1 Tax=Streptococcus australis TaxID=113107 RepID=UPI001CBF64E7|nr:DUF1642 domain-containing protein [Streptococcus australis]MBZ2159600.1 DUF1642 domain-containing protein [Streptococcus australis]
MNKQELIEKVKELTILSKQILNVKLVDQYDVIRLIKQLHEPQPIKLKDVIARIKQLDIGTRKVWLDEFLNELGSDYGTLKYKDGYEQGKVEGLIEREKVTIPKLVADWLEACKENLAIGLYTAMNPDFLKQWNKSDELISWFKKTGNQELFARAWLDGYEVEKEKRYLVKAKGVCFNSCLIFEKVNKKWLFSSIYEVDHQRGCHTRKELEEAGFSEVFNSPLFEVEEVEE